VGNIDIHRDVERDLTVFTAEGVLLADDVLQAVQSFYDGELTLNVLWDISGADVSSIQWPDIEKIVQISVAHGDTRVGGKTAVVATEDITFGLSRVYEMIKEPEHLPFQTRVFRSLEDAKACLFASSGTNRSW